jgi:hypothetical protein
MYKHKIILYFLLTFFSINTFAQVKDSIIVKRQFNYRVGFGIFSIPGVYIEKNLSNKISVEAGLISCIILNEASIGLKYQIYTKNNLKIKVGIGSGATAYFWWAKTDPPKSGKEIYVLPSIPIEFIYKKYSLELQPGYPISINGSDEAKIPIIVFLSYIF